MRKLSGAGRLICRLAGVASGRVLRRLQRRKGSHALGGTVGLAIVASMALAQTSHAGPAPDSVRLGPDAPQIYLRDCAWCHGPAGEGTHRGPTLIGTGAASVDFNLRTGRMPISSPDEQTRRSEPAYSPAEIELITEFVAGLGEGPPIPDVDPTRGDLGLGAVIYRDNCAACHSVTGAGGAMPGGPIAPSLVGVHPVEVAEAIRIGGEGTFTGSMPVFGPVTVDQHGLDSVVRYVEYLQSPKHPGGASLGRTGPVGEGFVALFIAMPALMIFMWWAGSRK